MSGDAVVRHQLVQPGLRRRAPVAQDDREADGLLEGRQVAPDGLGVLAPGRRASRGPPRRSAEVFQPSARSATVRSVLRRPEPPMRIGRCAWTGRGAHERVVQRVAAARRGRSARRPAAAACSITDSSSQSSRSPGSFPKSMPKASCSRSNQAAPMPSTARPPDRWSSVVASFAVRPGLRNVLAPTISPRRTRDVIGPRPASTSSPRGWAAPTARRSRAGGPRSRSSPSPPSSAARAASRNSGQPVACGQSWRPKRIGPGRSIPLSRRGGRGRRRSTTRKLTRGWRSNRSRMSRSALSGSSA